MRETLKPTPKEAPLLQVIEIGIIRRVELVKMNPHWGGDGSILSNLKIEEADHRGSVEEIASTHGHRDENGYLVVGIRPFKRVEGLVMVDGKPTRVSSGNLYEGTTYISGLIWTRGELLEYIYDPRRVKPKTDNEWSVLNDPNRKRFVKTRTGHFLPFEEGDRVISLPEQGK